MATFVKGNFYLYTFDSELRIGRFVGAYVSGVAGYLDICWSSNGGMKLPAGQSYMNINTDILVLEDLGRDLLHYHIPPDVINRVKEEYPEYFI